MKELLVKLCDASKDADGKCVERLGGGALVSLSPEALATYIEIDIQQGAMASHFKKQGYSEGMPTESGFYDFLCGEANFEADRIKVVLHEDGLYARCPELGDVLLPDYHNGLTSPMWRLNSELN